RLPVLDRDHAPRGKALAVPDTVDLVDDRHFWVAGEQKIGVQRMRRAAVDGAAGCHQGLADHLAAEHALPPDLRAATAKQVHLERLEIENVENGLDGRRHDWLSDDGGRSGAAPVTRDAPSEVKAARAQAGRPFRRNKSGAPRRL